MIAATTNKKSLFRRQCLTYLLCCALVVTPTRGWAEEQQESEIDPSQIGREAQRLGEQLRKATKMPTVSEDGVVDLGNGNTFDSNQPPAGLQDDEYLSVKELQQMANDPKSLEKAAKKRENRLKKEVNSPNPSISFMVNEALNHAKNRSRNNFENDRDLVKSSKILGEPGALNEMFDKWFPDCETKDVFQEKTFSARIPDYRHCNKLRKPKGSCTIHHTIEIATEPADIVFLVDNSGSMGHVIADLRANVGAFADLINQGEKGRVRIGGAAFRERDYGWNKVQLTDDIRKFQHWLNRVNIDGGETYPFDVIDWATKEYQWRANVHRVIVLIGNDDAGGNAARAVHWLNTQGVKLYVFHNNLVTKSIGTHLADHFSGPKLLKFAQIFTIVRDDWHPQSCIDDALATLEEFCQGHYTPTPSGDPWSAVISGFEVDKSDPVYKKLKPPPLPNVSKLASRVDVSEIRCSFNHGQGSCWIDPQGDEQCLQNDADIDECSTLEQNPKCVWIKSECLDGAKGKHGTCYVLKQTYDCGETVEIPTIEKKTSYECPGNIRCMGEDCIDVARDQSRDFARTAALLQAAEMMTQDMDCKDVVGEQNLYCKVFGGTGGTCKIAVGGVQNCCEKPEGVSMNDYLSLILAVPKLDAALVTLTKKTAVKGAYQSMRAPFTSSWEKIKKPFTSAYENISGHTKPLTEPFKKVYDATIGKIKTQIANIKAKVFGKAVVEGGAKQATNVAVAESGKKIMESSVTSLLGTAMSAYAIYSASMLVIKLVWKCEQSEYEMNSKRALSSCHHVGSYCKSKFLGMCIESREAYCCFNSPISRILQEQIRPQLGLNFGTAKHPTCGGIPMAQLAKIDWNRVNLDEWLAILQKNGRLPTIGNLTLDKITGRGNVLNVDGNRKNVLERTKDRIDGIDIDAIRQEAAYGGADGTYGEADTAQENLAAWNAAQVAKKAAKEASPKDDEADLAN